MKMKVIRVLDEKDEPIIKQLVELGLRRDVSEVMAFLDSVEDSSAKEIERGTGRRVTEVSRSLRFIRKKGWICETRHEKITAGRHVKYFRNSLSLEMWEIIDELEKMLARKQSVMG